MTLPTSDCTDNLHLDHKGRCKRTKLTSGTSASPHDACLKNCLLRSYFTTQLRRLDGATCDVLNGLVKAACTRASTLHVSIGSSPSYSLQHRTANFHRRLPAISPTVAYYLDDAVDVGCALSPDVGSERRVNQSQWARAILSDHAWPHADGHSQYLVEAASLKQEWLS